MQTQLLSVWGTVGSVVLAIFILLVMITVHEFGHYLAGKILKFKIDEFSVGFGPALFKRRRKKSGELFAVRLIPLGGYCSFHGEDGEEPEKPEKPAGPERPAEPVFEEEKPLSVPERTEVDKTEEPAGGPVETLERTLAEGEHSPENSAKTGNGGGKTAKTEKKGKRAEGKRDWNDDGTFTRMKPWKRLVVLVAGAVMNYLLALLLIALCFGIYGQSVVELYGIAEDEEYPAEYSFREGDRILEANGRHIYLSTDLSRAVNGCKAGDRMGFLVSRLNEDGTRENVRITVILRASVSLKNSSDYTNVWSALGAGIETHEDGARYYMVRSENYRYGFFPTLGHAVVYSFKIAGSIFRVVGELFTGRLGITALGGPVTTIRTTATVAAQSFRSFLEIAGFIGVNLAVFNLLPIPALDGSKVVFCVIEWVRGRPISRKVEAIVHAVGFVFLIGFAILVDILQFV